LITSTNGQRLPWQDPLFLVALLAGLLVWLALYIMQQPVVQWGWPLLAPWQFLVAVLVYPVLEEIAFRGLIQELVRDFISGRFLGPLSIANLLTSLLFTGLHFITHPPLWAALVFFPSLVFGLFKDRTHRLLAPILLHVFYNAGYFWLFAAPQ
jgi:membrane protease YdiL (CAAX protease family)